MENTINPAAEAVVAGTEQSNTNGVPGSLPGETRAETQARLYKVMVDGNEMEVDEDELKRGYAHNKAAAKRMEEASMQRKEAEAVLRMFRENPRQALQLLGRDARKFAEEVINEDLQEALLSPQERELRDYKRRVEAYESERRTAQAQFEKEQMEAEVARQAETIQNEIIGTLETAGLPKTPQTINRIVYYMQTAIAAGYNVGPKDVIDQVRKDYQYDLQSMLGGLSEDQIEMFLDSNIVRKIAKSTVKGARVPQTVPKTVNKEIREAPVKKTIKSPKDFFDRGF